MGMHPAHVGPFTTIAVSPPQKTPTASHRMENVAPQTTKASRHVENAVRKIPTASRHMENAIRKIPKASRHVENAIRKILMAARRMEKNHSENSNGLAPDGYGVSAFSRSHLIFSLGSR